MSDLLCSNDVSLQDHSSRKKARSCFCTVALVLAAALFLPRAHAAAPSANERLGELDRVYSGLALRSQTQRHTQGAILLGTGSLLAASGYFLIKDDTKRRDLGFGMAGVGAGIAVTGLRSLLWQSETETVVEVYQLVPRDDIASKVTTGEALLKTLASRARSQRLIAGSVSSLLGAGALAIAATSTAGNKERVATGVAGTGLLGVGLLEFFLPEDEEMALREYEQFLEKKPSTFVPPVRVQVQPLLVVLPQESRTSFRKKTVLGMTVTAQLR